MKSSLAFFIQRYFSVYLLNQRNYGVNTINSYRDTFRLLIIYLQDSGFVISRTSIDAISADQIQDFLNWLAQERGNSNSTKNTRLAHIKSFFNFILASAPEYSDLASTILNIPVSRTEKFPQFV